MSLEPLLAKRKTLIDYLKEKLAEEDFHGVRDVCTDLEKLDVEIATFNKCQDLFNSFKQPPMWQGWDISTKQADACDCLRCKQGD